MKRWTAVAAMLCLGSGMVRGGEPVPPTTREIRVDVSPDSGLRLVAQGAGYGALVGAIIPLAVNLIAQKRIWDVGPGAGIGALAGIGWGLYEYGDRRSRHLVRIENGRWAAALPALRTTATPDERRLDVGLLSMNFGGGNARRDSRWDKCPTERTKS